MITAHLLLMILAIVCLFLAAINAPVPPRLNLLALGLLFWALAITLATP